MGSVGRKIKRLFKTLVGKDFFPRIDCQCKKERLGSKYCGWEVAVEKITKDSVCYSFGVGEDVSFDLELINRFGVVVHAFDPTPRSINWVRAQDFSDTSFYTNMVWLISMAKFFSTHQGILKAFRILFLIDLRRRKTPLPYQ